MNPAQIHLLFNHFPIIGMLIGAITLAVGLGLKQSGTTTTALYILLFTSLMAIPTYLSGEGAEEIVEHLPNSNHDLIEHHEEEGAQFFYISIVMALLSLAAIITERRKMPVASTMRAIVLVAAFITALLGIRAGHSGGMIQHLEVREGFVPAADGEHEHHDDHDDH